MICGLIENCNIKDTQEWGGVLGPKLTDKNLVTLQEKGIFCSHLHFTGNASSFSAVQN